MAVINGTLFLYSQDLSNCTTRVEKCWYIKRFLYSQDLSNCTTSGSGFSQTDVFLYSQDLSNCTTGEDGSHKWPIVFVLSRFK